MKTHTALIAMMILSGCGDKEWFNQDPHFAGFESVTAPGDPSSYARGQFKQAFNEADFKQGAGFKGSLPKLLASTKDKFPVSLYHDDHGQMTQPDQFTTKGGDCKDYVMAYYGELLAQGIEPERMYIALFNESGHNGHAILVIDNDYVLDQRNFRVAHLNEYMHSGYQFVPYRITPSGSIPYSFADSGALTCSDKKRENCTIN